MKLRGSAKHRRHVSASAQGTAQQLLKPSSRSHEPRFDLILPSTMKELVAQGLFTADGVNDKGQAKYKITTLGKQRLAELEK